MQIENYQDFPMKLKYKLNANNYVWLKKNAFFYNNIRYNLDHNP